MRLKTVQGNELGKHKFFAYLYRLLIFCVEKGQ